MACCKFCCGCSDCAEGQQGKCCCGGASGTCCQSGEYCCSGACQSTPCESTGACCNYFDGGCYETTEAECWGAWQGAGTTCSPNPCPPPAYPGACCVDGVCQDVSSQADCTAIGGIYQGAYSSCADGDCSEKACVERVIASGCTAYVCEEGHFHAYNDACPYPDNPNPTAQFDQGFGCQDGTALHTTVTGSGAVFTTPDAAYNALMASAMNTSYAITRNPCTGCSATEPILCWSVQFPLATNYHVRVEFPSTTQRHASIRVYWTGGGGMVLAEYMARSDGTRTLERSACAGQLYDCNQDVNGAVTGAIGLGDYSAATIVTS